MADYTLKDLPIKAMEAYGINMKDIFDLPPRTINALLRGRKSSFMQLNNVKITPDSNPISIEGKLQFVKKEDEKLGINFYPARTVLENKFNLDEKELKSLVQNETANINKVLHTQKGERKELIVSFDHFMNEFVAVDKNKIRAPKEINSVPLTEQQKAEFISGRPIKVDNSFYRLNITNEIGVSDLNGNINTLNSISWNSNKLEKQDIRSYTNILGGTQGSVVLLQDIAKLFKNLNEQQQSGLIKNHGFLNAVKETTTDLKHLETFGKNNTESRNLVIENRLGKFGDLDLRDTLITKPTNVIEGQIIDYGNRKYQNNPQAESLFMVKLQIGDNKIKTIWDSKDLKDKIDGKELGLKDKIKLEYKGYDRAVLTLPVSNESGQIQSYREIPYARERWEVTNLSRKNKLEQKQPIESKSKDYSKSDAHFYKAHDQAAKELNITVKRDKDGKVEYFENGKPANKANSVKSIAERMLRNREIHLSKPIPDRTSEFAKVVNKVNSIDKLNIPKINQKNKNNPNRGLKNNL